MTFYTAQNGRDMPDCGRKKCAALKTALADSDTVLIGAGAGLSASAGFTYSGGRFEKYFSDEKHYSPRVFLRKFRRSVTPLYLSNSLLCRPTSSSVRLSSQSFCLWQSGADCKNRNRC